MRKVLSAALVLSLFATVSSKAQTPAAGITHPGFADLVHNYEEEQLKLNPIIGIYIGDNRYNDRLSIDFTESQRAATRAVNDRYLAQLRSIDRSALNEGDRLSYDVLKYNLELGQEGLTYKNNLLIFNQLFGLPNTMALLGSGTGAQPFKTVKDYQNWISRARAFTAWSDSALVYFRRGMAEKIVHPKVIVQKLIPQLTAMVVSDPTQSVFYGPVKKFPADFSEADKQSLTQSFTQLIAEELVPSYKKLADFLQQEYLPAARTSSGFGDLPGGDKMYQYSIRAYTTTNKPAQEIFNLGLAEVARIQKEMEKVKAQVGFTGSLNAFFEYMRTDPKFFPYNNPEEILEFYRGLHKKIEPALKTMFNRTPQTPFEVRQTEAFRAASAAAQYMAGSLEVGRPGIFYVPIVDVKKTGADEALFLHEAIPGHHYQLSLQNENKNLPRFRRYGGNSAYAEGWALYTESLGKDLGLYSDPYQYMKALGNEIHRAIRLVVDAGIHTKGWSREQAIKYMLDNEPVTDLFATSEIERYMANPGQALSYKIGELKIKELRAKYEKQLGKAFNLAAFHDAILMDGALPLEILERKMEAWAKAQKVK